VAATQIAAGLGQHRQHVALKRRDRLGFLSPDHGRSASHDSRYYKQNPKTDVRQEAIHRQQWGRFKIGRDAELTDHAGSRRMQAPKKLNALTVFLSKRSSLGHITPNL
jgi:hypothetical protein